jgi:amino acid transporter
MLQSLLRKKSIDKIISDHANAELETHHKLNKSLTVRDLTSLGIAAIIGAGIFSTIGAAAFNGGPGVTTLFIITAITCGFSALCYAEFASRVPISGSAYTYAYVSFGEVIAWIIGWALILEYAIGNIVVAISWSGYFNNLLRAFHIHLPEWLTTNYTTAREGYSEALTLMAGGASVESLSVPVHDAYFAITQAPELLGYKLILNLPAFVIVCLVTWLAYTGIKESKRSANFMVLFKVLVILFVIVVGFFYVDTSNWVPFMPKGFTGVLMGVSAVFYAYIGFDAISTTAEECKNPKRDLPRAMVYALLICTVLYILIALVLTGMVHYSELKVADPLAYVFEKVGLNKISYLISISAVVATTSVMLVFQLGQPRIWMSMSRDGLLPKRFATVHPKYKTPAFATIITGLLAAVPALFISGDLVTDLTSIGTLFAFTIVCFGVLMLPKVETNNEKKFTLPFISGRFLIPAFYLLFVYFFRERITEAVSQINDEGYQEILFLLFVLIAGVVSVYTFIKKLNFIPIMGALSCLYLMIEIPAVSWLWFFVWMGLGLSIYLLYGRIKSKLNSTNQ